ncbi:MAG: bacterial Ig-like domain-containing protein [Ruminococcus bromii]|nr:bacterial Ig-like domain-containing protein [Ruminococcus bromii]
MKKQWLSIVLVLCMVLCMSPATARAEESKTGTLKITVDISGVYEGDNVGDKTFSFEILRKYANYGHYKYVDITIKSGETEHTEYVPVEEGKYVVKQTGHATIDKYDWENASHQPGNTVESKELNVSAGKTERVTVHNFYEIAVTNEITELPIKINGYALNAKVGDIKASTEDQMRVTINKVTIKQRNASGGWDNLAPDATIQADIQYGVEILVNAKPGYTYASLTGDKVTVNGKEASEFENPSTQPGGDMRVFHEFEVLKVVKKVDHIEITTPPTKTVYKGGDKFDPTGMVVTAVYKDGTSEPITNYSIFHGDKLTKGQEYVTIQYDDGSGNSDIKVRQTITVGAYEGPHTHTYAGSPWYQDATSHWHQCTDSTCPDPRASATELASHTFVWKVDQAATTTQTGLKHEECTVCSYKRSENTVIDKLPATHSHSYGTEWKYDDTNHWHECECGAKTDIAAHSASEWIVDTAATETADGAKHKECTVCKKVLETATIPATGSTHTHSYGTEWKYDETNHWHECECGDKADTAAHSFQWVIDNAATNEATGIKHEECTVCGAKRSENAVIDKNSGSPETGDSSNLIGWLAALFVSGGVLTMLGVSGKKRKESEAE